MLSVESVPAVNVGAATTRPPVRLRLFPQWVKVLTIWIIICLLGTEWNWQILATTCDGEMQLPIDDTKRVTQFSYDLDGRMTQVCTPEGTVNYEYDPATGRRTKTYTDQSETRYTYDELGRLKTAEVHKRNGSAVSPAEVTTYAYTAVGSRESVTMPNGTRTSYAYDALNRLTNVVNKVTDGGQVLSEYRYSLHATGRRLGAVEITREDSDSYTTNTLSWQYDALYRLTNELSVTATTTNIATGYSYDLVGNRLLTSSSSSSSSSSSTSQFNANDQLTNEVRIVGTSTNTTVFTYDANGSLTNSAPSTGSATSYSYDLENRLAAATVNRLEGTNTVNVVASYVYNPFGIRVRSDTTTTINGGTPVAKKKAFVIDAHNGTGYAQVLEEKDGTGALTMSYTIGDDVIAQSGPSVTHHFGYDGHGSTRILTDDSAAIESGTRYNYDAYGVQVGTQSSVLSPAATSLLYTGEQFDLDLQQYYLRARYYDQSRGRFTQIDPFAGSKFDPQSLHKYSYVRLDPVNLIDPSGAAYTLTDFVMTGAIIGLIGGFLAGAYIGQKRSGKLFSWQTAMDALIGATVGFAIGALVGALVFYVVAGGAGAGAWGPGLITNIGRLGWKLVAQWGRLWSQGELGAGGSVTLLSFIGGIVSGSIVALAIPDDWMQSGVDVSFSMVSGSLLYLGLYDVFVRKVTATGALVTAVPQAALPPVAFTFGFTIGFFATASIRESLSD